MQAAVVGVPTTGQLATRQETQGYRTLVRAHTSQILTCEDDMMKTFPSDVKVRSAADSSASMVTVWSEYHRRWLGPESAVLAVAALLIKSGYRSFGYYLSAAKLQHIKSCGVLCQRL